MLSRRLLLPIAGVFAVTAPFALAQTERHGRKYKAPPETSHLEVLVVKAANGKVIENAAVIFHPTKDGDDEGNLEVKSGTDGKAFIDVIPTGSDVQIQVISNGFATHAETIKLNEASRQVVIKMQRPQSQVSAYEEEGKHGNKSVGVQEPERKAGTVVAKPLPASAPVIALPSLPQNPKAKGDSSIPANHNVVTPPPPPAKQPKDTSAPTTPVTDGSPNTSSPSN